MRRLLRTQRPHDRDPGSQEPLIDPEYVHNTDKLVLINHEYNWTTGHTVYVVEREYYVKVASSAPFLRFSPPLHARPTL